MTTENATAATTDVSRSLRAEIERLRAQIRTSGDPAVEARLVELRLQAAAADEPVAATAPSWWANVKDPFPDVADRPPVIGREELTAETLRGAIAHHGCLMVRGLVSPTYVERLCADIDETLAAFDRCVERGPGSTEPPWFVPFDPPGVDNLAFGRAFGRRVAGAVNAADAPRSFAHLIEAFDDANVQQVLKTYLGGEPCVAVDKCTFRRVPVDAPTGWHQDAYRFQPGSPVCDVWVALSACGEQAPGLELVPRRMEDVLAVDPNAAIPWVIDPSAVEAAAGATPLLNPGFEPGDAVIFDEMLLHRTGVFPGMTEARYGVDAWFFPAGTYHDGDMPVMAF